MDPRHRADEALARARARGAFVVTPDNATSPMDAASTVRISHEVVSVLGEEDPHSTVKLRKREPQSDRNQEDGNHPVTPQPQQQDPQQQGFQQQGPQPPQQSSAQQASAHSVPAPPGPGPQRDTGPVDTTGWPTEDPQKPSTQFHFPQEFPR